MTPSKELTRAFHDWFRPPAWAQGGIGGNDALFLLAMMEREKPKNVIEIGVAAGVSSAVMLWWLERNEGRLLSCEISDTCYFDDTIPVGEATRQMVGENPRWFLSRPGHHMSNFQLIQSQPFDFAFIDGSHLHPATTDDVLGLVDYMVPGSWLVLHDIRLMELYAHLTPLPDYGPQILFEHWVGEKIDGGKNIGAIRLYDGCEEELKMIREIPSPNPPPLPQP